MDKLSKNMVVWGEVKHLIIKQQLKNKFSFQALYIALSGSTYGALKLILATHQGAHSANERTVSDFSPYVT